MTARYARAVAAIAFTVLMLVIMTVSTPLWLALICAAAAMGLVPVFLPDPERRRQP